MIDGIAQPLISFIALGAWTVVLATSYRQHPVAWVLWVISLVYAAQSLTYLDIIGGDVAKTIALFVRVGLSVGAVYFLIRRPLRS